MFMDHESLRVDNSVADGGEGVYLVKVSEASSLCEREGLVRVSPRRAVWLLETLNRRSRSVMREFVSRLRLSPFPICALDDDGLIALLRGQIRAGMLVAVQRDAGAGQKGHCATVERRRLVSKIEGRVRGRLSLAGRSYKIVVDVDLAGLSRRNDYEVVAHHDGVRVLDRLAENAGGDLPALLHEAAEKLTRDWRTPVSEPDGLILLRHLPPSVAVRTDDGPITPSQIAKLMEVDVTLEVVVLGFDDKPLDGLSYVIDAPDGETYEGDLGANANTKVTSAKKGDAGIALKWSEAAAST
jgi:hypothetical protein